MKKFAPLLTLGVAMLCASCNKSHDPDAGLPAITFVSFEGIPASHVELDPSANRMTVVYLNTGDYKLTPGIYGVSIRTTDSKDFDDFIVFPQPFVFNQ